MDKRPFTKIDNTLLRCMCFLKQNQLRVLLFLLRFTTGFHTERCRTSYSGIAKWCGIHKKNAIRAVAELEEMMFLKVEATAPSLVLAPDREQINKAMIQLTARYLTEHEDRETVEKIADNLVENLVENL